MLARAINRTWSQILHPQFRSVFLSSLLLALLVLVALTVLLRLFWPESWQSGIEWVDEAGFLFVLIIGWYLLFPAIATSVCGLFLDKIARTVENEDYPHRLASRRVSPMEALFSSLKLSGLIILLNLLALIPYLALFFLSGGVGSLVLYLVLNGFLLGREYFELVASRHFTPDESRRLRKFMGRDILGAGMLVAALFLVPFLNLAAPIIGTAVMTHLFHMRGDTFPENAKDVTS